MSTRQNSRVILDGCKASFIMDQETFFFFKHKSKNKILEVHLGISEGKLAASQNIALMFT